MGFIVYNKDTKKYLKKHSGSYRRLRWHTSYDIQKELGKKPGSPSALVGREEYDKYWGTIHEEVSKRIFSAPPVDAREYLTRGGAVNSVGFYGKGGERMRLPDNLEIREIGVKIVIVYEGEKS